MKKELIVIGLLLSINYLYGDTTLFRAEFHKGTGSILYPCDVVISDGEKVYVKTGVTSVELFEPGKYTLTWSYKINGSEHIMHIPFTLKPGEKRELIFHVYDPSEIEPRKHLFIFMEEKGLRYDLKYKWDEDQQCVIGTLTHYTGNKYIGIGIRIDDDVRIGNRVYSQKLIVLR